MLSRSHLFEVFFYLILTYKLINKFDKYELLKKYKFKKILKMLRRAKKIKVDANEWKLINISKNIKELLEKLELLPTVVQEKKTGGRPKKINV